MKKRILALLVFATVGAIVIVGVPSSRTYLNNIFGLSDTTTARDWLQYIAWLGGAIAAIVALAALQQQASQSRAIFLLQLDQRWEDTGDARKKLKGIYDSILLAEINANPHAALKTREKKVRGECARLIEEIFNTDPDQFHQFIEYLGFYETMGLMVRQGYIPMRIVDRLYRGPIVLVDLMFRDHIEDYQRRAEVPSGYLEHVIRIANSVRRRERMRCLAFWR